MTTTTEYFGGCPECGQTDGYLNVRSNHWFVCDTHRTKWCIGANLYSSWHDETEADWRRNDEKLAGYRDVDPIRAEPTEEERRRMEEHKARLASADQIDQGYGVQMGPGDTMRALGPDDNPFDPDPGAAP